MFSSAEKTARFQALPLQSAAHRDKDREWGRLEAKMEPLSTLGNSGKRFLFFLIALDAGPRRPFRLELGDTKVYEPCI